MSDQGQDEAFDLDSVLIELGQFGKYQRFNFLLISLPIVFSGIYGGNYVFTSADVEYRCLISECEDASGPFTPTWLNNTIPALEKGREKCKRYSSWELDPGIVDTWNLNNDSYCPSEMFDQGSKVDCGGRFFYNSTHTVVSEFNLGCQEWKRTFIGTAHSVGLFASLAFVGLISDRYGRKVALILTATMAGLMGLIRSFTAHYITFLVFEFLDPALGSGVYSAGFVLVLELVGPNRRVLSGALISTSYAIGQIVLASVAYAIPYWRTLTRVLYLPSLLFVSYYWLVQESVRWLLSKGRQAEADAILKRAARKNSVVLSPKSLENLYETFNKKLQNSGFESAQFHGTKRKSLIMQVLKSITILSRVMICSFWWMTVTFVYYGLSINAVSLAGSSHVNYMLVSFVEIPGYLLGAVTLEKYGRKRSMMTAFVICGIACVSFPFIPPNFTWMSLMLFLVGKFSISLSFSSLYIYTSELFPTNVRHSLLAFCSMIGRIGNMVAPQTPLLALVMPSLPALLFGATSIISAALMLFTPETIGTRLPDTVKEAENISQKHTRKPSSDNLTEQTPL